MNEKSNLMATDDNVYERRKRKYRSRALFIGWIFFFGSIIMMGMSLRQETKVCSGAQSDIRSLKCLLQFPVNDHQMYFLVSLLTALLLIGVYMESIILIMCWVMFQICLILLIWNGILRLLMDEKIMQGQKKHLKSIAICVTFYMIWVIAVFLEWSYAFELRRGTLKQNNYKPVPENMIEIDDSNDEIALFINDNKCKI